MAAFDVFFETDKAKKAAAGRRTALLRGAREPGSEPILGLTNSPQDSLVPVLDKENQSERPEYDVHRGFDPVGHQSFRADSSTGSEQG